MRRKRILVLDDSRDILYTLEQLCLFQNWQPFLASCFDEAVEILQNEQIDLVLVDYYMPGMNGVQVIRKIRRKMPKIPIIVLTVAEQENIFRRAMQAGASDYALKPIKVIDLIARIKAHLNYTAQVFTLREHEKGISAVILEQVEKVLQKQEKFLELEELEKQIGIKKKTLHRYLLYLVRMGKVQEQYSYGELGRPKILYLWNQNVAG